MYAIVKEESGEYYFSTVFGFCNRATNEFDYNHNYWIVLNREKTTLINKCAIKEDTEYIIPMVLIVDSDESGWNLKNSKVQSVDFLPTDELFDLVEENNVPQNLLDICIKSDAGFSYNPYPQIRTEKDIQDFNWVSGWLHDARIAQIKEENDTLYVLFKGMWGCDIEVWFTGNIAYDSSSRDPHNYDPYWFGSTLFFSDGYIYLIDDEDATTDNVRDGWCWFRAEKMKYHIIPK